MGAETPDLNETTGAGSLAPPPGANGTWPPESVPASDIGAFLDRAVEEDRRQQLRNRTEPEFVSDGFLMTDMQGVILESNYAAAALLAGGKPAVVNRPLAFFLDVGSRAAFYKRLAALLRFETDFVSLDVRLKTWKGESPDVRLTGVATPPDHKGSKTLRWQLRDVSARSKAAGDLKARDQLIECVVEGARALILIVKADGEILRSNSFARIVTGFEAEELYGNRWCERLIAPAHRPIGRKLVHDALVLGSARSGELTLICRGGGTRSVRWTARVFEIGDGKAVTLIGQDATELHDARQRVSQAERLAVIGRTAAALAHESRNALQRSQACLTMLNLRLQGQPETLDLLHRLQLAQDDLLRLFEDVRGFAAPIHLERTDCDLRDVWRQAWDDLAAAREGKKAELREEIEDSTACAADPHRIRQVFRNLFENALGAAGDGAVVTVRCVNAVDECVPSLRVLVGDNGPGFDPDQHDRAFDPFFTTKANGTGLGLAICRRVVEAHGGSISLLHTPPPGTQIVFTLPRSMS